MLRMDVKQFFESQNVKIEDNTFVMCACDTYTRTFEKGKFYPIIKDCVRSDKRVNVYSMPKFLMNKTFIPLQGTPDDLTLRDRLMILIRVGS